MIRHWKLLITLVAVAIVIVLVGRLAWTDPDAAPDAAGEIGTADDDDHDRGPDDDDDDDAAGTRVEIVDGMPIIFLGPEDRQRVGIETAALERVRHQPEITATATVIDIQPLLAHRGRCINAKYEVALARARLAAAEREHERLHTLNQDDGNVAAKLVQEAAAKAEIERVALLRSEAALDALVVEAQQSWGGVVSEWLMNEESTVLAELVAGEQVLLLVVLPYGRALPPGIEEAKAAVNGGALAPARLVSRAPYTDPLAQGESYFFRAPAAGLRTGMRATVRIPTDSAAAEGVVVPDSAVVWALGDAWTYLAIDDDHFARIGVATDAALGDGWFVGRGIAPGERIVVTGAQTLYAEEFRWQVFEEDDD